MSEAIYVLSYADYDTYDPMIVAGPVVEDWEAFCLSLLNEAARNTLVENPRREQVTGWTKNESWIGWQTIRDDLFLLLESKGYRRLRPPEFCCGGTGIIDSFDDRGDYMEKLDRDACQAIINHNLAIRRRHRIEVPEEPAPRLADASPET